MPQGLLSIYIDPKRRPFQMIIHQMTWTIIRSLGVLFMLSLRSIVSAPHVLFSVYSLEVLKTLCSSSKTTDALSLSPVIVSLGNPLVHSAEKRAKENTVVHLL
jgi:hypothetical protein